MSYSFDEVLEHLRDRGMSWVSLYLYFSDEGVKVEMVAGKEREEIGIDKYDRIFQKPVPLNDIPALIMSKIGERQ